MPIEKRISLLDEFDVKTTLGHAGFIPSEKENCLSLGVKGEGDPPFAIRQREPKLLHVRVLRPVQSVAVGPPQLRSEPAEQADQRGNFKLRRPCKFLGLGREGRAAQPDWRL